MSETSYMRSKQSGVTVAVNDPRETQIRSLARLLMALLLLSFLALFAVPPVEAEATPNGAALKGNGSAVATHER